MTQQQYDIESFLRESNAIEKVYDDFSFLKAKEAWEYLVSQNILTVDIILQTHKILMVGKLEDKYLGKFRDCNVRVGSHNKLHFNYVRINLEQWVKTVMDMKEYVNIIGAHIIFENIHPFIDGNGRIGRMLMLWMYIKYNKSIEVIYEKNKQDYYKWFN